MQHAAQTARSQRCAADVARAEARPGPAALAETMEKYIRMETEKGGKGKLSFDVQA